MVDKVNKIEASVQLPHTAISGDTKHATVLLYVKSAHGKGEAMTSFLLQEGGHFYVPWVLSTRLTHHLLIS